MGRCQRLPHLSVETPTEDQLETRGTTRHGVLWKGEGDDVKYCRMQGIAPAGGTFSNLDLALVSPLLEDSRRDLSIHGVFSQCRVFPLEIIELNLQTPHEVRR